MVGIHTLENEKRKPEYSNYRNETKNIRIIAKGGWEWVCKIMLSNIVWNELLFIVTMVFRVLLNESVVTYKKKV